MYVYIYIYISGSISLWSGSGYSSLFHRASLGRYEMLVLFSLFGQ